MAASPPGQPPGTTLTDSGGAVQLVDPDGTIYQFNSNGTLNYVEDTHGNRITAGYNAQGQLASLTDSNGEYLDLAYNSQGLLATLTDSTDRPRPTATTPPASWSPTPTCMARRPTPT